MSLWKVGVTQLQAIARLARIQSKRRDSRDGVSNLRKIHKKYKKRGLLPQVGLSRRAGVKVSCRPRGILAAECLRD
eukprot:3319961-Amphidinium_carterae.1